MESNDLRSLWEQRLAEYNASGKTIKAWCQEQAIKESQYYYWRRKLRGNQVGNNQAVKWLSLDLDNAKQSITPGSIAVHVGQVTVEIKKGFDQQLFREIIHVLHSI